MRILRITEKKGRPCSDNIENTELSSAWLQFFLLGTFISDYVLSNSKREVLTCIHLRALQHRLSRGSWNTDVEERVRPASTKRGSAMVCAEQSRALEVPGMRQSRGNMQLHQERWEHQDAILSPGMAAPSALKI